jgi:orotidine-5'-phosphate decarboxylase
VLEQLPPEVRALHHEPVAAVGAFCRGVLNAVAGLVPAVKVQSACFERYGAKGVAVLEECIAEAVRLGLVVVLDAKRGDISTSAAHYAAAAKRTGAHAITVNAYLGRSGIEPFLSAGLGVFALVRTSNPDSDAIQGQKLADGRTVAEMVADEVAAVGKGVTGESGLSDLGAVVGATKSSDGAALRARMPDQIFLVPGSGAQGGTADDIRSLLRKDRRGVLVTASRSIIYPTGEGEWTERIKNAARRLAAEVAEVVKG